MFLENLVFDSTDPRRLGRFWEDVVGSERLTDESDAFETRLAVVDGPTLDLCFQRVPVSPAEPLRVHLDLYGAGRQAAEVDRLLGLGARHLDIGQGSVPWVVLADPEGNPFCVREERPAYAETGPIAALPLDSADTERDADFWAWLTGWTDVDGVMPRTLRHVSQRGLLLELCPEPAPKGDGKNRLHLDVRLEACDEPDAVAAGIQERGGYELHPDWGDLPWRVFNDPSGNEFCVLPSRA
jgi:predicted enzyme related to lactoylglutathione lyase